MNSRNFTEKNDANEKMKQHKSLVDALEREIAHFNNEEKNKNFTNENKPESNDLRFQNLTDSVLEQAFISLLKTKKDPIEYLRQFRYTSKNLYTCKDYRNLLNEPKDDQIEFVSRENTNENIKRGDDLPANSLNSPSEIAHISTTTRLLRKSYNFYGSKNRAKRLKYEKKHDGTATELNENRKTNKSESLDLKNVKNKFNNYQIPHTPPCKIPIEYVRTLKRKLPPMTNLIVRENVVFVGCETGEIQGYQISNNIDEFIDKINDENDEENLPENQNQDVSILSDDLNSFLNTPSSNQIDNLIAESIDRSANSFREISRRDRNVNKCKEEKLKSKKAKHLIKIKGHSYHKSSICDLNISPCSTFLISSDADGFLIVFNRYTGEYFTKQFLSNILISDYCPGGVVVLCGDGTVHKVSCFVSKTGLNLYTQSNEKKYDEDEPNETLALLTDTSLAIPLPENELIGQRHLEAYKYANKSTDKLRKELDEIIKTRWLDFLTGYECALSKKQPNESPLELSDQSIADLQAKCIEESPPVFNPWSLTPVLSSFTPFTNTNTIIKDLEGTVTTVCTTEGSSMLLVCGTMPFVGVFELGEGQYYPYKNKNEIVEDKKTNTRVGVVEREFSYEETNSNDFEGNFDENGTLTLEQRRDLYEDLLSQNNQRKSSHKNLSNQKSQIYDYSDIYRSFSLPTKTIFSSSLIPLDTDGFPCVYVSTSKSRHLIVAGTVANFVFVFEFGVGKGKSNWIIKRKKRISVNPPIEEVSATQKNETDEKKRKKKKHGKSQRSDPNAPTDSQLNEQISLSYTSSEPQEYFWKRTVISLNISEHDSIERITILSNDRYFLVSCTDQLLRLYKDNSFEKSIQLRGTVIPHPTLLLFLIYERNSIKILDIHLKIIQSIQTDAFIQSVTFYESGETFVVVDETCSVEFYEINSSRSVKKIDLASENVQMGDENNQFEINQSQQDEIQRNENIESADLTVTNKIPILPPFTNPRIEYLERSALSTLSHLSANVETIRKRYSWLMQSHDGVVPVFEEPVQITQPVAAQINRPSRRRSSFISDSSFSSESSFTSSSYNSDSSRSNDVIVSDSTEDLYKFMESDEIYEVKHEKPTDASKNEEIDEDVLLIEEIEEKEEKNTGKKSNKNVKKGASKKSTSEESSKVAKKKTTATKKKSTEADSDIVDLFEEEPENATERPSDDFSEISASSSFSDISSDISTDESVGYKNKRKTPSKSKTTGKKSKSTTKSNSSGLKTKSTKSSSKKLSEKSSNSSKKISRKSNITKFNKKTSKTSTSAQKSASSKSSSKRRSLVPTIQKKSPPKTKKKKSVRADAVQIDSGSTASLDSLSSVSEESVSYQNSSHSNSEAESEYESESSTGSVYESDSFSSDSR